MKNLILTLTLLLTSLAFGGEKVLVMSDTHFYGPHALNKKVLEEFKSSPVKVKFSLGDIYDIKWTSKDEIKSALKEQTDFSSWLKSKSLIEIEGNHDLNKAVLFYVRNGVLYTHGHYVSWNQKTIDKKAKASRDGVSKLKRKAFEMGAKSKPFGRLSKQEISAAVVLAKKYGCHTIVFGHTHVEKTIDTKIDGIRIINVPRGLTLIEV